MDDWLLFGCALAAVVWACLMRIYGNRLSAWLDAPWSTGDWVIAGWSCIGQFFIGMLIGMHIG